MTDGIRNWLYRNAWICPLIALFAAGGVFVVFGLTPASAIVVVLMLVCPALLVWGIFSVRSATRKKGGLDGR